MRIRHIVKSTAVSDSEHKALGQPQPGTTKYFHDFVHASFHIQASENAFQFKLESDIALSDDTTFYALSKATQQRDASINKLETGRIHEVYIKSVHNNDDAGGGHYAGTYTDYISTEKSRFEEAKQIFIDDKRNIFWIGEKLAMQPIAPELAAIRPSIDSASSQAMTRRKGEYRQAASHFAQQKMQYEAAERELKSQKAQLEMEAAMLASDAVDFSQ